jgi:hypothetical protein
MPSREVRRLTAVQMDVVATTKRSVAVVGAVAGVLLLLLLAWIGGESHYRSCLTHAELTHPVAVGEAPSPASREREEAIDGCSRMPW